MPERIPGEPVRNFERRLREWELQQTGRTIYGTTSSGPITSERLQSVFDAYLANTSNDSFYQENITSIRTPGNTTKNIDKPIETITDEVYLELDAGRRKLEEEELKRNKRQEIRGQKEREYLDHFKQSKHNERALHEWIRGEVPVFAYHTNSHLLKEADKSGMCSGLRDGHYYCQSCGLDTPREFAYICFGGVWCSRHVPRMNMCIKCRHILVDTISIKTFDGRVGSICTDCKVRGSKCNNCGTKLELKYAAARLCAECVEHIHDGEVPLRGFSLSLKWVGKETGAIVKSPRMFSCEVEAMSPFGDWAQRLHKTLPKETGIGTDGSVGVRNQAPYGFEVQTPRLAGKRGEELVHRLCSSVKGVEAVLDNTCGMHIHLDGAGLIDPDRLAHPTALLQLWKSSIVFEDVILSFLPFSRRGNDYCRTIADVFQLTELDIIDTLAEAEKLWYRVQLPENISDAKNHHRHTSRYFGANFHSLFADGHFEVRYHSGTINARKILEWANLHALIMDACVQGKMTREFLKECQTTSKLSEKTEMLFNQIGLAGASKQYFMGRQNKFSNKKEGDDELKEIPRKVVRRTLPEGFVFTGFTQPGL